MAAGVWQGMLDEWDVYVEDVERYNAQALKPGSGTVLAERAVNDDLYYTDVLVGFRNTGPTAVNVCVQVGSWHISTAIPARGCALALGDNCVPMLGVFRTYIRACCPSPDVKAVVAFFVRVGPRIDFVRKSWQAGPLFLARGLALTHPPPGVACEPLPRWTPPWLKRAAAKKHLQDQYLRELMAVACHPSRILQIGCDLF